MGYGFVIDQRKCIGCHACTVACKSENEVPVGNYRTWVRYTEQGSFPTVKRHFTVLRCNHCDSAPCVEICPVSALSKRADAIVDLDRDQCIGCKSCMQGCPYDAIYLNEDSGVAEKCHYCAHRTEMGLEPACVVVCPEQAIVAGDLEDPASEIATLVRQEPTSQRRLDKGTRPRVWYVDALEDSLIPNRSQEPEQWLWSDRSQPLPDMSPGFDPQTTSIATLNATAKPAWGWHVWVYLVTKNLSAGAMMLAPFAAIADLPDFGTLSLMPEIIALVFLAITNVLLVHDLGRPERFWKIMFQPNTSSWLVKGAWILTAFGLTTTASLIARSFDFLVVSDLLRWFTLPLAVLTAGYSAWLFAQCRGRDLWIEPGLFVQLVLRAATLAAGLGAALGGSEWCHVSFAGFLILTGLGIAHERSRIRKTDWEGRAKAIVHAALDTKPALIMTAIAVVVSGSGALFAGDSLGRTLATVGLTLALAALLFFERAWIRAGQVVPNS